MVKLMVAAKPYQAQVHVNDVWGITPVMRDIGAADATINVATQNQLQAMTFHHWEINGKKVSTDNPATLTLPMNADEIEVYAVFK